MADEEQGQGFTVRDRRVFAPEREETATGEEPQAAEPKPEKAEQEKPEPADEAAKKEAPRAEEQARDVPLPEPSFSSFLTFFFFQQVLMCLGDIPHPETGVVEKNLPMARYLIDMMAVLKEKTKGNLTADEEQQINSFLTELRMRYVQKS
jgi:hypothetical protein